MNPNTKDNLTNNFYLGYGKTSKCNWSSNTMTTDMLNTYLKKKYYLNEFWKYFKKIRNVINTYIEQILDCF